MPAQEDKNDPKTGAVSGTAGSAAPLRLFVAVALPEWMKDMLLTYLPAYRHPAVRLVPRENLHLTLHFIGNISAAALPTIDAKLQHLANAFTPFRLYLQELSPGPSARNPRLVWARFGQNETFEQISVALAQAIGGQASPHLHPVPHVTLARLRKDVPKPTYLPVEKVAQAPELEVNGFALWQSTLDQPQPHYAILKAYSFPAERR